MEYKYYFEKLDVWMEARSFVKGVYAVTKSFPDGEKFGLVSQLQRAAVSVVSNIAEGVSRKTHKEQLRFIEIAYGSLMETLCQFYVAFDLNYISEDCLMENKIAVNKIANQLNALSRAIDKRGNS